MQQSLPAIDLQFREAFNQIMSKKIFSDYIKAISICIIDKNLDRKSLEKILMEYNVQNVEDIKQEVFDLLLAYINLILEDNFISEDEAKNLKLLKRLFRIKEGDFYDYRYKEIEEILNKQFHFIYSDNQIDVKEALHKVGLQELFDLSYDQFLELVDKEVKAAVERGANSDELDTVFLKAYQIEKIKNNRQKNFLKKSLSKIFRKL